MNPKAIRNMEPAWEKIAGSNFRPGSYKDANGQMRPCYQLTKTECLYIATKFNEEGLKARLLQMNYSCLPNADGSLKGSRTMSTTVGMDIDHTSDTWKVPSHVFP